MTNQMTYFHTRLKLLSSLAASLTPFLKPSISVRNDDMNPVPVKLDSSKPSLRSNVPDGPEGA